MPQPNKPCCQGTTQNRQTDSASIKKARENQVNAIQYREQLRRLAEQVKNGN